MRKTQLSKVSAKENRQDLAFQVVEPTSFPYYDYRRYSFSLAVRKGDYVFTSGHSASEFVPSIKKMVCKGGLAEQTRTVHDKIKLILGSAGMCLKDIVKITDYVCPAAIEQEDTIDKVRAEYFEDGLPAVNRIYVEELVRPDALLEVECVAVKGRSRSYESIGGDSYGSYPLAARRGNLVFSSLLSSSMPRGSSLKGVALRAQAKRIYRELDTTLNDLGSGLKDVVKVVEHVSPQGLKHISELASVRRQFFSGEFPAVTQIATERLSHSDVSIEIEAVAVLGGSKKIMIDSRWTRYTDVACSPAVRKNNLIFVSAMLPIDYRGGGPAVGSSSTSSQIRQVFDNTGKVLEAAGASFHDVVKTVDYLVPAGLEDYRRTADVRRVIFKKFPASSGVLIKGLPEQNALIQVESIAISD